MGSQLIFVGMMFLIIYFSDLFYWIFVLFVQKTLDHFKEYWNYHEVRYQPDKFNPSGHVPANALENPSKCNPNAISCFIQVEANLVKSLRGYLEWPGSRQYFEWYSDDFDIIAKRVFEEVGSLLLSFENAWDVFKSMSTVVRTLLT
jgi:hypothetical protein